MKIMHLCLAIIALLKISDIAAMEHNNISDSGTSSCQTYKAISLLGGMCTGCVGGTMLCLKYIPASNSFYVPAAVLGGGFGGGFVGLALGFGIAYAGTKMYETCVLYLQVRQNLDSDYQPVSA